MPHVVIPREQTKENFSVHVLISSSANSEKTGRSGCESSYYPDWKSRE